MKNTVDIVSSLLDEILVHVLSFLSTKQAVRTCLLSKRWRNIWASVPVLKFDVYEFYDFSNRGEWRRRCDDQFVRFMWSVLNNRGPSPIDAVVCNWYLHDNRDCRDYMLSMILLYYFIVSWPRVVGVCFDTVDWSGLPGVVYLSPSL